MIAIKVGNNPGIIISKACLSNTTRLQKLMLLGCGVNNVYHANTITQIGVQRLNS